MKKSLAALLPRLLLLSLLTSVVATSTGCIVRPIGYGHHHHWHRGW